MATGTNVVASNDKVIDSLLSGTKWAGTALTIGFPTSVDQLADYETALDASYFKALDASAQMAVQSILSSWSTVSGVTFTTAATPDAADIRVYSYLEPANLTARTVGFPSDKPEGGDIQLGGMLNVADWSPGSYAFFTLMHELGHALGLKHPHDTSNGFPAADAAQDSVLNSVMSYASYPGSGNGAYSIAGGSYPTGPMLWDIAALQYLYGANWVTNSGDSVYTFDPSSPVLLTTIWDGGGIDTYNLINYTTDLTVDLRPGAWTDVGGQHAVLDYDMDGPTRTAPANIANALLYQGDTRSLIENVRGGSGKDSMTGNQANNRLEGNAGDDILMGLTGDDELIGGADNDTLDGGDGHDWLEGGAGDDDLTGGAGTDRLYGGDGNDTLDGGAGEDFLSGGSGVDVLTGGAGVDVFDVQDSGSGVDIITDFGAGDRIRVQDLMPAGTVTTGDGSSVLAGDVQLSYANGVTTLFFGLDGVAGADLQVQLNGRYGTGNFTISDDDLVYRAPAPTVPPVKPPVVTHPLIDGVKVRVEVVTNTDGTTTQTVTVPQVQSDRADSVGDPETADIDLITNRSGEALLKAKIPVGVSLHAEGTQQGLNPNSVVGMLLRGIEALGVDTKVGTDIGKGVGGYYAKDLADHVGIHFLTPTVGEGATTRSPLDISGGSDPWAVVVVDSIKNPHTPIVLRDIDIGVLLGDTTATVSGMRALFGDDNAQTVTLGGFGTDVHGGGGFDTVIVQQGVRSSFSIDVVNGGIVLQSRDGTLRSGELNEVEAIQFGEQAVNLTNSEVGQLIRLYKSAFERNPDAAGLNYWIDRHESGEDLRDIAQSFLQSEEFAAQTGELGDAELVDLMYRTALNREADAEGRAWHLQFLENGGSRAQLLLNFAESQEQIELVGVIDSSIELVA